MTDKSKEVQRAKGESQIAFEKRLQREALNVVKKTEAMADAINPGIDSEPTDASAKNPLGGVKPVSDKDQKGRLK